ncbi:hypothetical protein O181_063285 [Austropuccinia psidii MF-1]|uniref:Uncharacterized protein n=1 Tax=Austropuccinia psidii MF-1 TaxID=1389203 RepID=A0A9Q3I231_9BASI|nr:hypothetical protein [Austropuccinia psidii MF-1]
MNFTQKSHTYNPTFHSPKLIVTGQSTTGPKLFVLMNQHLSLENELTRYKFGGQPARSGTWKIWPTISDDIGGILWFKPINNHLSQWANEFHKAGMTSILTISMTVC